MTIPVASFLISSTGGFFFLSSGKSRSINWESAKRKEESSDRCHGVLLRHVISYQLGQSLNAAALLNVSTTVTVTTCSNDICLSSRLWFSSLPATLPRRQCQALRTRVSATGALHVLPCFFGDRHGTPPTEYDESGSVCGPAG
ncbi:hypothetical protein CSUI_007450 [Cystoisospora suis]|uniref:Uncharacterized protein n=1 Tax=Cystoisospora suis TaxID=483139 RepID=A0A2C6KQK9_9APIC|nr:hypothetical protein CSUI_007450 [Cystoisospora suis]